MSEGREFSEVESRILQEAFKTFSELFLRASHCHRDVCLKNFIFTGRELVLIDFLKAVKKENPLLQNPSVSQLSGFFGLGAGFNPKRGCWNDNYSLLVTYQKIMPILTLDETEKSGMYRWLQANAQKTPTIHPVYQVDEAWQQAMRKAYWKLCLRPLWTSKKSSREKRGGVRSTLAQLLKARPNQVVPTV